MLKYFNSRPKIKAASSPAVADAAPAVAAAAPTTQDSTQKLDGTPAATPDR